LRPLARLGRGRPRCRHLPRQPRERRDRDGNHRRPGLCALRRQPRLGPRRLRARARHGVAHGRLFLRLADRPRIRPLRPRRRRARRRPADRRVPLDRPWCLPRGRDGERHASDARPEPCGHRRSAPDRPPDATRRGGIQPCARAVRRRRRPCRL
ncbi:hypothetical protein OY671_012201, partial [Metschnikowia pulcherrima]